MRNRVLVVFVGLVSTLTAWHAFAQPKPRPAAANQPATADPHAKDRAAILAALKSFATTFAARDAKALAAHFTTDGELRNVQGTTLRGREALEQAFAQYFSATPEVQADIQSESLRMLSADSGIDEGTVRVQRGPTEPATVAHYSVIVVREGGNWRVALMTESPVSEEPSVDELSWLIGRWKSASGSGTAIETSYAWDAGKKFIRMQFTRQESELTLSGTQLIGVDPLTGMLHSWTFEASGGVGEADWLRDGDHWVLEASGTFADGRTLTETNVLRRVDADTFTWQSTSRMLDDVEMDDLPPVKVTRIKD